MDAASKIQVSCCRTCGVVETNTMGVVSTWKLQGSAAVHPYGSGPCLRPKFRVHLAACGSGQRLIETLFSGTFQTLPLP